MIKTVTGTKKNMKLLSTTLLLILLSYSSLAEECVFDIKEQKKFNENYVAANPQSYLSANKSAILIPRDGELIKLERGGCVHFGINVTYSLNYEVNEKDFFKRVLQTVEEFGTELIPISSVKNSLEYKNYHKDLTADKKYYFIGVKEVASFEAYYQNEDGRSTVEVGFYIN